MPFFPHVSNPLTSPTPYRPVAFNALFVTRSYEKSRAIRGRRRSGGRMMIWRLRSVLISRRTTMLGTAAALAAAATPARAEDTIKIGVVSPLTGPAAESGGFMRNGIKLAVDAVNASGGVLGKQLETVVEDDQTTNPGAVLA